jgi:L-threonylcarbamoyladenylate synthase
MEKQDKAKIKKAILDGKIFIYPTDTVYGLGCNAFYKDAVQRIRQIKGRDDNKPLSVIAPSLDWIHQNFIFPPKLEKYLPGSYTLILQKLNPKYLSWVSPKTTLGIRIPEHSFTKIVQSADVPFITTSVNKSGQKPAIKIKEIPEQIKKQVHVIIYSKTELSGKPSTLIKEGKLIKRS